ncbi:hypothetical protein CAP35_14615 [Chitinophagaceae bacterium IBVUCB1]|nr:hypothetical protein CAP35_14615 [Chitinophagaceae bacterium IBVUCB1]
MQQFLCRLQNGMCFFKELFIIANIHIFIHYIVRWGAIFLIAKLLRCKVVIYYTLLDSSHPSDTAIRSIVSLLRENFLNGASIMPRSCLRFLSFFLQQKKETKTAKQNEYK